MGFPHPTGAEERQIVSPLDPIGVLGQVGDLSWVDLSTDAEVKLTERLGGRQVGLLEITLQPQALAMRHLIFAQDSEVLGAGPVIGQSLLL